MSERENTSIRSIIGRETILWAILTGLSYYFVFNYQKQYLDHFGISEVYVEVSLGKVLSTSAGVVGSLISYYYLLAIIPKKIVRPTIENTIFWLPPIMIGSITYAIFDSSGYTWISVITFFLTIALFIYVLIQVIIGMRSGKKYAEIVEEGMSFEIESRKKMVGTKINDTILDHTGPTVFIVLIFSILGGGIFGEFGANSKKDFLTFTKNNTQYAIVQNYADGLLAVSFELDPSTPNSASLTGETVYLELEEISGLSTSMLDNHKLLKNTTNVRKWVSFSEFWADNFEPVSVEGKVTPNELNLSFEENAYPPT